MCYVKILCNRWVFGIYVEGDSIDLDNLVYFWSIFMLYGMIFVGIVGILFDKVNIIIIFCII